MTAEDEDEFPHVNREETDEEAQGLGPAFDDDLDSEVNNFTIKEDDCVFMTMVHPVDPHHFVRASSMVSGRLAEAFAKNSKPKGFEDMVPTSLHTYADVFSETAFDSCKGTSILFLTSPILSHSPPVHMYPPSPPLYYLQGSYLKPTTSRPKCPTTFQKSTHR
jgi:hypothetical protein